MVEHGPIFGAMLEEFEQAARILNLDPGIWKILTHPKRQITVSCPIQLDNGQIVPFCIGCSKDSPLEVTEPEVPPGTVPSQPKTRVYWYIQR